MIKKTTTLFIVAGFLFTLPVNAQIMDDSFFEVFMENYRQYSPPRYDMDVSKSDFVLSATEMVFGIDLYTFDTDIANLEQFRERILEMISFYEWLEDTGSLRTEAVRAKVLLYIVHLLSDRVARYGANELGEIMDVLPKQVLTPARLSELYQKEFQIELPLDRVAEEPLLVQYRKMQPTLLSYAKRLGRSPEIITFPLGGDDIYPETFVGYLWLTQVRLEMLQIMYQVSLAVNLPYMNIPRDLFVRVYNDYYEKGELLLVDPERADSTSYQVLKPDDLFTRILQHVTYPREALDEPRAFPPELEIIPTPTPPLEPTPTPTPSRP